MEREREMEREMEREIEGGGYVFAIGTSEIASSVSVVSEIASSVSVVSEGACSVVQLYNTPLPSKQHDMHTSTYMHAWFLHTRTLLMFGYIVPSCIMCVCAKLTPQVSRVRFAKVLVQG
jgi:hypothetical protein